MIDDLSDILSSLTPEPKTLCESAMVEAAQLLAPAGEGLFAKYRYDALGYFKDVLKTKYLSEAQLRILKLVSTPANDDWKRKLAVGSSTNYGKTHLIGGLTNWYYDSWGPCVVATTAPSYQSVVDLLWKEVRVQRSRADNKWGIGPHDFIGPQAPQMRRSADWWAKGFVATKGENWKGRHDSNMFFVFDEATALMDLYFRMTKTMFKTDCSHLWMCTYNPTDASSPLYQEIMGADSDWEIIELSSLDHPNVIAELRGDPAPIPPAVSLSQLEDAMRDECDPIDAADAKATDFEWRPGSGHWFRPSAVFEGNFMGRWPTNDESSLWSDALWKASSVPLKWSEVKITLDELPRLGCDVAYLGKAKTSISVTWGDYAVFHESKGGQQPMRTVGRLVELAEEWAEKYNEQARKAGTRQISGKQIPIKVDDQGIGGGVVSRLRELQYNVWPVGASDRPLRPTRYYDKRSELWFVTKERASMGKVKLGLLDSKMLSLIRKQAMAPMWELMSSGQRRVERKEMTESRLGTSIDEMDAVNLSYYHVDLASPELIKVDPSGFIERTQEAIKEERQTGASYGWRQGRDSRRGLFKRY